MSVNDLVYKPKDFPVGDTTVLLKPPTFEHYMELQTWIQEHQPEKDAKAKQGVFWMGVRVQCLRACIEDGVTAEEALQVFLDSGGVESEIVLAAMGMCTTKTPVAKETLDAIPISSLGK